MSDPANTAELNAMRIDYAKGALDEQDVAADPIDQFGRWFDEARAAKLREPNAMTLATADAAGRCTARIVLLKNVDASGFTFYTNYASQKGVDLAANPRAALLFFWAELERQVRVEGTVDRVPRAESAAYFATRPRAAQVGAWASAQSETIASRAELEERDREAAGRFAGGPVPLPDGWGGYRMRPTSVEFWQGRSSRLHDRLRYRCAGDAWIVERLSP